MSGSAFDFRPIDLSERGIEECCAFLRVVFPDATHLTPDYLRRLYFGNPLGETWGLSCLDDEGNLVGHYIMIPIRARCFGREETGIWPFQLATHPGARMKGLFFAMTEATNALARERGFTFLAGVGNQNSSPIFVKKWGYQAICNLDVKVGVGALPQSHAMPDAHLDRIWEDPASIAWRLGHHQRRPYRVQWRGDVGHILADTGRHGIRTEIGAFPRDQLPKDLPEHRGANPLRIWIGKDPTRDFSGSLYYDIPIRFRPSPLILLWYDLTGEQRTHDPERVRYEAFDFDPY